MATPNPPTTRHRTTYAYRTDSPTGSRPASPALDDQEQEDLIATLAQKNATRNLQFQRFLFALPLFSSIPYILLLFTSFPNGGHLIALLALTSLACTAWILLALPAEKTGIEVLDSWAGDEGAADDASDGGGGVRLSSLARSGSSMSTSTRQSRPQPLFAPDNDGGGGGGGAKSPLEAWLPGLNVGLCGVLVVAGWVERERFAPLFWGHVGLGNLPAVVFAVVMAAKMFMGGVDPERELGRLRYEYKGA